MSRSLTSSKVWYTLEHGRLTEVYYPDLGTPSIRDEPHSLAYVTDPARDATPAAADG